MEVRINNRDKEAFKKIWESKFDSPFYNYDPYWDPADDLERQLEYCANECRESLEKINNSIMTLPTVRLKKVASKPITRGKYEDIGTICQQIKKCCENHPEDPMNEEITWILREYDGRWEILDHLIPMINRRKDDSGLLKDLARVVRQIRHSFYPLGVYTPSRREITLYYGAIYDSISYCDCILDFPKESVLVPTIIHVFTHELFHALHHQMAPAFFQSWLEDPDRLYETLKESLADFYAYYQSKNSGRYEIARREFEGWKAPKRYYSPYDKAIVYCDHEKWTEDPETGFRWRETLEESIEISEELIGIHQAIREVNDKMDRMMG